MYASMSRFSRIMNEIFKSYDLSSMTRVNNSLGLIQRVNNSPNIKDMKMWVFGYGSLVWKADFPFEYKLTGHIKGFNRRFYQHSTDHRGTPDNPGRVVTLLPSNDVEAKVWGIAYKIRDEDIADVIDHLDYREKGGYQRKKVMFYPKDVSRDINPFDITIYVGTSDNFQYAGEADIESIARQVHKSVGPSGSNIEYVCNLAKAMREIAPDVYDDHLFALESRILDLMKSSTNNIRK